MDKCILAIDLGTSGCKAAIVDVTGNVRAWEFRSVDTLLLPGGGAEQNPEEWWQAIVSASTAVLSRQTVPAASIIAVCANTQGEGTLPVDENGAPLCNAILWMDTRGAAHVRKRLGGPIRVAGFSPEKLFQYIRLTGGAPSLTGKDPVGHMLFIQQERPEIYARTYKFLNVLDYVNWRLCGRIASTDDSLMTSWVTDNRRPGHIKINPGLCNYLGIPPDKIPAPVPCIEILGEVGSDFAQTVGLMAGTPVVAGSIDTSAAAIGAGTVSDADLHLYLGTSTWLAAHVAKKKTDLLAAIASVPCGIPDKYLMTALQATAGGNLTFLRDKVLYNQDELLREECSPDIYKILDRLAEASVPGAHGIIYTPWIYGERAPVEDHHIRAGIHNLSLGHARTDIVRAIFEGIALNSRWVLKSVDRFLGRTCDSIAAVGGGANSAVWCQIYADVLNRRIRQTANPIEANVRGSAYIAAVALGKISFNDVPNLVQIQKIFEPRPETRAVYNLHFQEFQNLYRAMKGICRRLNTFHGENPS